MEIGGEQHDNNLEAHLLKSRTRSKTESYLHEEVHYGALKIETISFVSFLLLLLNNWPQNDDSSDRFYDYHSECLDTLKSIWFVVSLLFVVLDFAFLVPLYLGYIGILSSPSNFKLPSKIRKLLFSGGWNTYTFYDMVLTDLPIASLSTILFIIDWYCSSIQYSQFRTDDHKVQVSSDLGERLLVIVINLLVISKIVKAVVDWRRGKSPDDIIAQELLDDDDEEEYEDAADLGRSSMYAMQGPRRWEKQPQIGRTLEALASHTSRR